MNIIGNVGHMIQDALDHQQMVDRERIDLWQPLVKRTKNTHPIVRRALQRTFGLPDSWMKLL